MPLYNKPEFIIEWERNPGTPRYCWTCTFFDKDLCTCVKHENKVVPEAFAANRNPQKICQDWRDMDGGYPF